MGRIVFVVLIIVNRGGTTFTSANNFTTAEVAFAGRALKLINVKILLKSKAILPLDPV